MDALNLSHLIQMELASEIVFEKRTANVIKAHLVRRTASASTKWLRDLNSKEESFLRLAKMTKMIPFRPCVL